MKKNNSMRPFTVQRHFIKHNPGSVLISFGDTKVICSATIENSVPRFLRDSGKGWLTSEYSLLPSSTFPRAQREAQRGKVTGRTTEIQRLIGRSLRAVIDFDLLGERTIYIDADVKIRAQRRYDQLREKNIIDKSLEDIMLDIKARDFSDKNRDLAPLIIPDGAFEIDNSKNSIEITVKKVLELIDN